MKKYEFMNVLTGECHTLQSMLNEWRTEYDGADPSNALGLDEYYMRLAEPFEAP